MRVLLEDRSAYVRRHVRTCTIDGNYCNRCFMDAMRNILKRRKALISGACFAIATLFIVVLNQLMSLDDLLERFAQNRTLYNELNIAYDEVTCSPGIPCLYPEQVDFRIIVLTYNRPRSLKKLLKSLNALDTDGEKLALEIWIDQGKDGLVSVDTINAAVEFNFILGKKRVHVQQKHVGIYGQWIDTWRVPQNSTELAVILEDDLTLSPYSWRYLRRAHALYGHLPDCGGYTLQCENINIADEKLYDVRPLEISSTQDVFMYRLVGTWGFMPHPQHWTKFQDWYHKTSRDLSFRPYVPGIKMTEWYQYFERKGEEDTMWEMWYIYYSTMQKLYTVYPNNNAVFNNNGHCLSVNRQEAGLHYEGFNKIKESKVEKKLLKLWSNHLINFPESRAIIRIDYSGNLVT